MTNKKVTGKKGTKNTALRNFHACHPIMRKGGVHEKSKSSKRAAAKRETRRKASEWLSRSSFSNCALESEIPALNFLDIKLINLKLLSIESS